MRPKELILHNIGPFAGEHCIPFDQLGSLFLICGQTGAGKTTLFDALSYAFYGKPLGGRENVTKTMRSHFAPESAIARVILTFFIGNALYRITRTLPYTKKGNKNETPEEVAYAQYVNAQWKDLTSTNKRETDTAIKNLIKLTDKEFARIVLLPQGEFAQFLQAHSSEKKETLMNLFPVARYTHVMKKAKNNADILKQEVQTITRNLEALMTQFAPACYDEDCIRLQKAIDNTRRTHTDIIEALTIKHTQLEQEKILHEKRTEYARISTLLQDYQNREHDIATLAAQAEAAEQALPLATQVNQLHEIEATFENTAHIIAEKTLRLEKLNESFMQLECQRPEITEKETLKDQLTASLTVLEKAVHIEATLQADEKTEALLQQNIDKNSIDLKETTQRIAETQAELAALQHDIDNLDERQAHYQELQEQLTVLRSLPDIFKKQEESTRLLHNYTTAQERTETELQNIYNDIAIFTESITQLEQEKHNAENQHRAATLAQLLTDGNPCPVCGSTQHPQPAQEQHTSVFSIDERIQTAQRSMQALQKQKESVQQNLAESKTSIKNYQNQLAEYKTTLNELHAQYKRLTQNDFPVGRIQAVQQLAETAQETERAAQACNISRKALNKKKALEQAAQKLQQQESLILQEKNDVLVQLHSLKSSMREKRTQFDHAYTLLPQEIPQESDAETTFEHCTALLQEIRHSINAFHTRLTETIKNKERIEGELAAAKTHHTEQYIQYTEKKKALEQSLHKAGFTNLEALQNAICDEKTISGWKTMVKEFNEQYIACKQSAKDMEKELERTKSIDSRELEAAIEVLTVEYETTQKQLEQLTTEKAQLDEKQKQHTALTQQLLIKTQAAQQAISLSDDLNGSNSRRLQFDTWILSHFLREVTIFANTRLERMSEGRYHITVSEAYGSGNNYKGLDLEIADAYTGKSRPSASLSGGETFMASISLALGLADSIQTRAGGIRIDSMFIDEGFGSLDEKALENAITILDEIRGNRMVGIISHVSELKNRIPQKIEVIKTGTGSYIAQI